MLAKSAAERGLTMDAFEELVPAGRLAAPQDHAQVIAFLASEEAAHVTGQVISVDGGQSLNWPMPAKT
jgi:NAD(P)-dependent dehydrogenase (short-subunit alcohol dehydrogenase family)